MRYVVIKNCWEGLGWDGKGWDVRVRSVCQVHGLNKMDLASTRAGKLFIQSYSSPE
jgi:hypothetical protein